MKTTISLLFTFILISSLCFSQTISTGKVPKDVKKTFSKENPKAMKPIWSMSDVNYKVDFLSNGSKNSMTYDKSGKWLDKTMTISIARIPKEVKATLSKEFPGFRSTVAEQITSADNVITYHVGIVKAKEAFEVYFSATGDVIKKEPKAEITTIPKKK